MACRCEVCGQAFPCDDSRLAHFISSHCYPESTVCPLCDLAGVSIDEMTLHIECAHPIAPIPSRSTASMQLPVATSLPKDAAQTASSRAIIIEPPRGSSFAGHSPATQSFRSSTIGSSGRSDKKTPLNDRPNTASLPAVRQGAIPHLDMDDGRTCTTDAVLKVRRWLSSAGYVVMTTDSSLDETVAVHGQSGSSGNVGGNGGGRVWLCTMCDHLSSDASDTGWGCGYRNTQMLLSALMHDLTYNNVLFDGRPVIPSILKIQKLIESAWRSGFDRAGAEQLGGVLVRTRQWIGASDIWALFTSLRVRCQLVDFHRPSGPCGTHPKLLEWVKAYFQTERKFTPPVYFQHQGHSRTIVGYTETPGGEGQLLLFDPSDKARKGGRPLTAAELVRRCSLKDLSCDQYQVLIVTGLLSTVERDASKLITSTRVP